MQKLGLPDDFRERDPISIMIAKDRDEIARAAFTEAAKLTCVQCGAGRPLKDGTHTYLPGGNILIPEGACSATEIWNRIHRGAEGL